MVQLLWIAVFKNPSGKNWNFSSSSPFLSREKYLSVFFLPWTGLLTTTLDFVGLLNTLMFSNKHILHVQVWKFSVILSVMWMFFEVLSAFLIRLLAFVKQCWMRCCSCFLLVWVFLGWLGSTWYLYLSRQPSVPQVVPIMPTLKAATEVQFFHWACTTVSFTFCLLRRLASSSYFLLHNHYLSNGVANEWSKNKSSWQDIFSKLT